MISLFIDTCSKKLVVALYRNLDVIGYHEEESDNNLSVKLLPKIDEILKNCNLSINNIDKIFVANGPGSFTGIRIGVTTAKTIAWGLNKEIYTVSELEVMATTDTNKKFVVPLIDARRGYVFSGLYDKEGNNIIADKYVSISTFYDSIKANYDLSDISFVSYDDFEFECQKPSLNVWKLIEKYKDTPSLNPHKVNPNYLKLTEAEEKLNDKRDNF